MQTVKMYVVLSAEGSSRKVEVTFEKPKDGTVKESFANALKALAQKEVAK